MQHKNIISFILLLICIVFSNTGEAQLVNFKFEQIDSLQRIKYKPVLVFIHTNWCKYCKAMESVTFKNEEIIAQINKDYYCVLLNAETKNDIYFNNKLYHYQPTGVNTGINELAEYLASINKEISYPTTCVLNFKNEIIFQQNGFLSIKAMKYLLELFKIKVDQ